MPDPAAPPPYHVRPATEADLPFVLGSWLENFRRESPWAHRVTNEVFFAEYRPVIVALAQRSTVLIAEGVDGQDLGDVVFDRSASALHWAYVLKAWRRLGIGRALLTATGLPADLAGVRVTHPTWTWFTTQRNGPGLEERFRAIHDPCLPFYLALHSTPGAIK